uniref:Carbohydrate kinase family protein n=1 Tax=Schlesneria paludicola TaxID=360056 RepID=A0A7C4QTJ3_9PLAN
MEPFMMRHWDCLCAGVVVADLVCEPMDAVPPPGGLGLTPRMTLTIGGCAANVAVDMATLGLRVRLSGCVGDDLFGRAVRDMLERSAVDCGGVTVCPNQSTSATCVLNVRGEDRRFIHCIGANAAYDGTQISDADLQASRVLYLGGYCLLPGLVPDKVRALFQRARAAGAVTVLNVVLPETPRSLSSARGPSEFWDWLEPVLPCTDYFFPNSDEAARMAGATDVLEQAVRFRTAGCRNVIITQGEKGAVFVGDAGAWSAGVHPVPTVDATGTGDAFVAGFVLGLLRELDPVMCLRYGSAMGAHCVQALGATTGALTEQQLQDFVDRHPLPIRSVETTIP